MEKKQKMIEFLKKAASVIGEVILLILYFFTFFCLGIGYVRFNTKSGKVNPFKDVKSPQTISVAINESNDIVLMNKTTGEYQIYSDSVGLAIFKLYANKMYVTVNNETTK